MVLDDVRAGHGRLAAVGPSHEEAGTKPDRQCAITQGRRRFVSAAHAVLLRLDADRYRQDAGRRNVTAIVRYNEPVTVVPMPPGRQDGRIGTRLHRHQVALHMLERAISVRRPMPARP